VDQQQIKAFIDAMAASDLTEMEFSQDGWTLRLVRRGAAAEATPRSSATSTSPSPQIRSASDAPAARGASEVLTAPVFGIVHLQQAPGDPPFVRVGQSVKEGHTLCVIEAMKVFNEVRAEHDCTVAEVLVASGQEVEAGQPLLRLA
jgi:acetyl-CoA carboxylase biotin carboxyl carrier protein